MKWYNIFTDGLPVHETTLLVLCTDKHGNFKDFKTSDFNPDSDNNGFIDLTEEEVEEVNYWCEIKWPEEFMERVRFQADFIVNQLR